MEYTVLSNSSLKFVINPDYINLYDWEKKFDLNWWQEWYTQNWTLSFQFTAAYLIFIVVGNQWMKNRQPYKLKIPLIIWNITLSLFSVFGFVRTVPEILSLMSKPSGFYLICCSRDSMNVGTVAWTMLMAMSKAVELGDTVFIIMRKQKLIFLHWYHHITVMLYVWYTYVHHDAAHRVFMNINLGIHGIMYAWYALRALGIKLPKFVSVSITSMQIIQMVVGTSVNVFALYMKEKNIECQTPFFNIWLALGMYVSYWILFINFFYKTYLQSPKKRKTE